MKFIDPKIQYFSNHQELALLVDELWDKLLEYFGDSGTLNVIVDEEGTIWGNINSNHTIYDSLIILDSLEENWYFNRAGYVRHSPILSVK